MPKYVNWLPGTRVAQLAMAKVWHKVLTSPGAGAATKAQEWGIPLPLVAALDAGIEVCDIALAAADDPQSTQHDREECTAAFVNLEETMRTLHPYFYLKTFPEGELGLLGLEKHDHNPTPIDKPTSQFSVEVIPNGLHRQRAIATDTATKLSKRPDDVHGFRWGWQVGGTKPAKGSLLPNSVFDRHIKRDFDWEEDMRGQTVYYAVCPENGKGGQGDWSDVIETTVS